MLTAEERQRKIEERAKEKAPKLREKIEKSSQTLGVKELILVLV